MMIFLLIFLLFAVPAQGAVLWESNFDEHTSNFDCDDADGDCSPQMAAWDLTNKYTAMHQDTFTGSWGAANTQITTLAERSQPGVANKRGFRINLDGKSFPTGENSLEMSYPNNSNTINTFYLRWYNRYSFAPIPSYVKIFRMYRYPSGQVMIPDWQNDPTYQFVLYTSGDNSSWGYMPSNVPLNTWVCFEMFIDIPNQQVTLWINGLNRGTRTNTGIDPTWRIAKIEIGGNQDGYPTVTSPNEHTIDYDDIVLSTTYVGPADAPPVDSENPVVTITSPTASSTYSQNTTPVTVSGTATDNTAVTSATWTNSAGGTGTCTLGTGTFSCASIVLVAGTNTITIRGYDAAGNVGLDTLAITYDATAPTIVSTTSASQTCSSGSPATISLTATTGETARCRYSATEDLAYSSMSSSNTMDTTYALSHTASLSLACGSSYTYYVACIDSLGNASTIATNLAIPFAVAAATDTTPPVISALSPSGTVACAPNPYTPTITATTDEAATCRWGQSDAAYASLTNLFSTTGGTSHSSAFPISVACPSTNTVYVRCINAALLPNLTSTSATFTMGTPPIVSLASLSPSTGSTIACPSTPVSVTLSFLTNISASCRYHSSSSTWADMAAMSSTGSVNHSQTVSLVCGASYTYLFKCRDSGGDESGLSYTSFSVTAATTLPTNLRLYNGAEMLNGAQMR